ncbi:unnamed protein product [Danaus chrysippus]|uniref:(African queen) hypothetical protein n=1 Tax=Danaus chrysippus TaxID=151541 RepID=A0A8J2W6A9_9NEOP|nr:unnamed protein product [Danaus chrysippus]
MARKCSLASGRCVTLHLIHPQLIQSELIEFAQRHQLVVMAFSPFGSLVSRYGHTFPGPTINDPVLTAIARTHHKTTPQVVLRWLVSKLWNILALDGSNWQKIDLFDFQRDVENHLPHIKVHAYFAPVTPPAAGAGSRPRYCRCCTII